MPTKSHQTDILTKPLWTVILAAGEGSRLRPLTRMLHGVDLPKQFATIVGGRSLLQATVDRALCHSPKERIIVVVAQGWEGVTREQLRQYEGVEIVVQPRNLHTAPGLLLPLSRVAARDPNANVVVLPSDHFVQQSEPFIETIHLAAAQAEREDRVVLVGAVPDQPETQYGWIVPRGSEEGVGLSVALFHEKPQAAIAQQLLEKGALWNTFVMVASLKRFLALTAEHLPEQARLFNDYRRAIGTDAEPKVLARMYESMTAADFSRDVLQKATDLGVARLCPCGWSDWGTPARVFSSLRGTRDFGSLIGRVRAATGKLAASLELLGLPEPTLEPGELVGHFQ